MTDQHLRRSNWPSLTGNDGVPRPASSAREQGEDPLAELARLVGKSDPFADLHASRPRAAFSERQGNERVEPVFTQSAPQQPYEPLVPQPQPTQPQAYAPPSVPQFTAPPQQPAVADDDFFGIDAAAFEAALQAPVLKAAPVAPVAPRAEPALPDYSSADELERLVRDLDEEMLQTQAARSQPRTEAYPVSPAIGYATAPAAEPYGQGYAYQDDPHYDLRSGVDPQAYADPAYGQEDAQPAPMPMPVKKRGFFTNGGLVTVASVLGLVVVGVAGAGLYSNYSGNRNKGPVVIRADDKPNKVQAEAAQQGGAGQTGKLIYDRAGGQGADAPPERMVSRQEQPVDTTQPANGNQPRVVLPGGPSVNAPVAPNAEPRRVSTTTIRVRPDGTVEAEPTKPVAPAVAVAPPVSPAPAPVPEPVAPVAASAPPSLPSAAAPIGTPLPKPVTTKPVVQAKVEPQRPTARAPTATSGPMALMPPSNAAPATLAPGPTNLAAPPQRVASAPVAAPVASGSGTYFVQVSSQRSDEAAKRALGDIQRKHSGVLAGQATSIKAVEVAGSGTYYRVRVGPMASRDQAVAFCGRLKANGGDCYVP